jgi:hypothetical protein
MRIVSEFILPAGSASSGRPAHSVYVVLQRRGHCEVDHRLAGG